MNAIAAIRTHRWTGAEARLLEQLRAAFGEDVCVVFHDRAADVTPPCDVVDLSAGWVQAKGLRTMSDWGWRCGDYFLYALREAKPDYDHYWIVEPDVLFMGDPAGFFTRFEKVEADILGLDPAPLGDETHVFKPSLPGLDLWRAIFALTRMSGRVLDRLLELRRENSKAPVGQMRVANDEAFVFTHAMAAADLTVGNLRDYAPDWFEGALFDTAPDLVEDAVLGRADLQGKVLHPVLSKGDFKSEIANRVAKRIGFLQKLGDGWDHLDAADVDDIADEIRVRSVAAIKEVQRKRRRAMRKARMRSAAE